MPTATNDFMISKEFELTYFFGLIVLFAFEPPYAKLLDRRIGYKKNKINTEQWLLDNSPLLK